MKALIEKIGHSFTAPLPGRVVQYKMAHAFRGNYPSGTDSAKRAGVLLLLFPKKDQWHVVFIQRPSKNPHDHHSGQISFPGGKFEETDSDLEYTALREAQEEVGVNPNAINILGKLTELYIPVSNFLVAPYVGFTNVTPQWIPQESEVADIIEYPLLDFRNEEIRGLTNIKISQNIRLQQVPYFDLNGRVLWGATAMMLNEFLEMDW